jgi:GT2 family glycosyltransferase
VLSIFVKLRSKYFLWDSLNSKNTKKILVRWSGRSFMAELSIIIVNWNTRELLRNCLASIYANSEKGSIRIIVVDNASKDGSSAMVKDQFPEVRLINSGGNIGFARANNLAMSYVDTPLVLFLNPDTLIVNNAVAQMINFMNCNKRVGALGCKIKCSPEQKETFGTDQGTHPLGLQWFPTPLTELLSILFLTDETIRRFRKYLPYKDPHTSGYVIKLYGTSLMVRAEVLERVGLFDEQFFMYGEDVDLSMRIRKNGWQLYYLSEAEIIHLSGGASSKASNQFSSLMTCESINKLMKKHYGRLGAGSYRAGILFGSLWRLMILYVRAILMRLIGNRIEKNKSPIFKYMAMLKWGLCLQKPEVIE